MGTADAGADERRDAPPGSEIEIGVGEEHPGRVAAFIQIEAAAARTELGVAAECLERRARAVFSREIGAQPVVQGVADADTIKCRVAYVDLIHPPACGPDERRVGLEMIEGREVLLADPDV